MYDHHEVEALDPEIPVDSNAALFLGSVGSREVVEVVFPYVVAPDGAIGLPLDRLEAIAQSRDRGILWVRTGSDNRLEHGISENPEIEKTILAGGLVEINHSSRQLNVDGQRIHLANRPFTVLEFLARNIGHVKNREEILRACVDGNVSYYNERIVDIYVLATRKALGNQAWVLKTRWGTGYLVSEDKPS